MNAILLSINPQYVKSIMCGEKTYEYRKTQCKKRVDKIIIYSTSPVMKVIGEADVDEILVGEPKVIWEITHSQSGIEKSFFDEYYKGKMQAVAYKLKHIIEYDEPKDLIDYGIKNAPQSFQYINVT